MIHWFRNIYVNKHEEIMKYDTLQTRQFHNTLIHTRSLVIKNTQNTKTKIFKNPTSGSIHNVNFIIQYIRKNTRIYTVRVL